MGEIVYPSWDNEGDSDATALVTRYAAASDGWIGKSDTNYMAFTTTKLSGAPLNACDYIADGDGTQAVFDTFESFIGGKYVARDTQTTYTVTGLAADSTHTFYLGYLRDTADGVQIGVDADFGWQDPRIPIWDIDLNSNSNIIGQRDRRQLGIQIEGGGGGVDGNIPGARLEYQQKARQFDFVPANTELRLTELVVMDDSGSSPGNLNFHIQQSNGTNLYTSSGTKYQSPGSDNPLTTVAGAQNIEFVLENQTTQDPGVFSARWKYDLRDT